MCDRAPGVATSPAVTRCALGAAARVCCLQRRQALPRLLLHNHTNPVPTLQVDTDELEDARWFHSDFLAAQLRAASRGSGPPPVVRGASSGSQPPFRIPGPYALANRIISSWLHERQQRGRPPAEGGCAEDAAALAALAAVPDVSIDEGSFKYVLLRLSTADGEPWA